ncbi:MAG: carbohydrate kinase [Terrimonas sp.]|nr:carbohydrate kinase [Terrimonas sp.]
MKDLSKIFNNFNDVKVGVIGDLMLDTYMIGKVERISPEAPVPVVTLHHKEGRIGGAGNVALNCSKLGAAVFVLGVTGTDEEGKWLQKLLRDNNISTAYLSESSSRITTSKTRIISRNQQMMRLDAEVTDDLDQQDEAAILHQLQSFIEKEDPDILIFEDYNKGVLSEKVIHQAIEICRVSGILTAVDPKRKNFFSYRGVDIFKPNLKEVKDALNIIFDQVGTATLKEIHKELHAMLHHKISFITLSEHGVFYQQDDEAAILPSHIRNISDVSGAGDTVIAVAALVYAVTKNIYLMAEIANIAGGLVCEEVGTAAVNKNKLLSECELLLS